MQPLGENASNIPAFLGKLWKMVNDPNTDHLICWSMAGNSFIIQNQAQFWYELLPVYYKHNNMSSFVRQLNMYGFHKISTVENGTMDSDKDEIQFYHKYFQRDHPELLKNIKRKVTASRTSENVQNLMKNDDIAKVLTDVKQLRGRQSSVDSQLSAMKQENAVLWRELAILRQKHIKQQQIVNKLIQFLVTLVQPSTNSRMGVGTKRRMPLMLDESPSKKSKNVQVNNKDNGDSNEGPGDSNGGPTIHELDNEIEVESERLLDAEIDDQMTQVSPQEPLVSPATSDSTKPPSVESNDDLTIENIWDEPEFVDIRNLPSLLNDNQVVVENVDNLQSNSDQNGKEVFLNPTARDTLLSNLVNGSYNSTATFNENGKKIDSETVENDSNALNGNKDLNEDMTVATRDVKINNGTLGTNEFYRDDLDIHLETTQSEIDQLRDFLHGYNTFDANTLLGNANFFQLFSDEHPDYGLTPEGNDYSASGENEEVSGNELANFKNTNLIDFDELLDNSLDGQETVQNLPQDVKSAVNTPSVVKAELDFSSIHKNL